MKIEKTVGIIPSPYYAYSYSMRDICYLIQNSQAVKKRVRPQKCMVKEGVKSK